MSLTSFLSIRDVVLKVKPLRPKPPRKIGVPLIVEPRTDHYTLVGTAFDYLLRFELQRRAPHAVSDRWVAEYAPELIWWETGTGAIGMVPLANANADLGDWILPDELAESICSILEQAKAAVAAYVKSKTPSRAEQTDLAAHAIRLAKLDAVYRAFRLDPEFEVADPNDVEDLLSMLTIVPFDSLLHKKLMLLNPNFRESSKLLGGADTDLITGDTMVDFKATKRSEMQAHDLDQILGYFLLARHQRCVDPSFSGDQ